jgi:glycosyltransferase involved in cell wall biosynthesis
MELAIDTLPGDSALRSFEAGDRRVLIHLMKFKQALTSHLSLAAAFDAYRRALDLPGADKLRLKPVASLRSVAERRAGAFHETAPAGEPFVVAPPNVIGDGNHRTLRGAARSMFVGCLIDARVRGRSAFVEVDDMALLDFQGEELARIDDQFEIDPAVFHATDNAAAWFITPENDRGSIELDEGFALLGPWTHEFGHWMWDYLPRLLAALTSGALPRVPIIVDADLPKTHRQALELMLPEGTAVVELPAFGAARVRRLWCAPSLMHMPLHEKDNGRFQWDYVAAPPERFAAVIREMVRRADRVSPPTSDCERLFLARKPGMHHPLVNAAAIEAIARERGFVIVYPEDHDFAEQVSLLRQARFVLGPDGSAINFLSWFARPGTRLCNLTHDYTVGLTALTGLLSAAGIEVTVFAGRRREIRDEYPEFVDYDIDAAAFEAFLDQWIAAVGGRRWVAFAAMPDTANQSRPEQRTVIATTPIVNPLVSIVYTTYNQEKFARDAVRSVLDQTYPNIEIVILDDASSDRTPDIISTELAKHSYRSDFHFIHNERNIGAFDNTEKGLSLTQGDFIVLFNGDDIMQPNMIEEMVKEWRETQVSLVTVNALYIDENGIELNRFFRDPSQPYDDSFETLVRDGGNAVCFGAGMGFERDLYVKFGWPPEYLTAEDLMIPFYAYLCKGARFIPQPLMKYRVHAQNTSMSLQWERAKKTIDRLLVEAEDCYIHIAHAVLMISELDRLAALDPTRYGNIRHEIRPLLTTQVVEMSKKMVKARIALRSEGVKDMGQALAQAGSAIWA